MKPCYRCRSSVPDECYMLLKGILKKTDEGDFKSLEIEGYLCESCVAIIETQEDSKPLHEVVVGNTVIY